MKSFEIKTFQPVKGKTINIREENHGADKVKCVDWRVSLEVTNEWLARLDPDLKAQFWRPIESTDVLNNPELEDVALPFPLLRNNHLKYPIALAYDFVGYQLTVDRGMGGKSNIVLLECKVNAMTLDCKEGGGAILSIRIQATGVSTEVRGQLSDYIKGAVTAIALKPPEERQEPIDGTVGHPGAAKTAKASPAPAAPGPDAGDILAANEAAGKNSTPPPKKRGRPAKNPPAARH